RRHTSFSRDWSSDVCSSDLIPCVASVFSGTDRLLFTIIMLVENHITAVVDKGNDIARIRAFLEQPAADKFVIDLIKAVDIVLRQIGRASCRERVYVSDMCGD